MKAPLMITHPGPDTTNCDVCGDIIVPGEVYLYRDTEQKMCDLCLEDCKDEMDPAEYIGVIG